MITRYHHDSAPHVTLEECKLLCLNVGNACGSFDYNRYEDACYLNTITYQQALEADPSAIANNGPLSIYSRSCDEPNDDF